MGLLNEVDFGRVKLSDNKILDDDGNICFVVADAVPADGTTGYAQGCILINRANATVYINTDTDATCDFDAQVATALSAGVVLLAHLAAGITPSHVVKYAGEYTTTGGNATEAATVTGVAATDIVVASIMDNGTNNVTLLQAATTLNTITFTFSADPGADAVVSYAVYRAAA